MCLPLNEYRAIVSWFCIWLHWERIWCTPCINNGSIIVQINFGFLWFSDYSGISIWTYILILGLPIVSKGNCLNYSRSGSIHHLRPVLYLLNHFQSNEVLSWNQRGRNSYYTTKKYSREGIITYKEWVRQSTEAEKVVFLLTKKYQNIF